MSNANVVFYKNEGQTFENMDIGEEKRISLTYHLRNRITKKIANKITMALFIKAMDGDLRAIELLWRICGELDAHGAVVNINNSNNVLIDPEVILRAREYAKKHFNDKDLPKEIVEIKAKVEASASK